MSPDFFRPLKASAEFMILRHGESEGNASQILQGHQEYPLTEKGKQQAAARGRALIPHVSGAREGSIKLYSSPQGRARETAEIIAQEAGLQEPVFMEDLMELNLGIWTGKLFSQLVDEDLALWENFQSRSWDAIPGAEPSKDLYERALRVWTTLKEAAVEGAEKCIVITHGGLIQWLVKRSFQCQTWFPLIPISNCGLFRLRVVPNAIGNPALFWDEMNTPLDSPF